MKTRRWRLGGKPKSPCVPRQGYSRMSLDQHVVLGDLLTHRAALASAVPMHRQGKFFLCAIGSVLCWCALIKVGHAALLQSEMWCTVMHCNMLPHIEVNKLSSLVKLKKSTTRAQCIPASTLCVHLNVLPLV